MNVLIIGGTGLISTAITRQLIERGDHVTIYNRGRASARYGQGAQRLFGDRYEFDVFEAQMRALPAFDCVIDMICYEPEHAASLKRAFSGHARQIIMCSTVDVYHKPYLRYPVVEDARRGGINRYGGNKSQCEDMLFASQALGHCPVTIIRPAQTYGEGGALIHSLGWSTTFLDRIRKGKPVIIHGDGMSLWSACHVDDVARAFVGAVGNPAAFGKAYNVTGEEWLTWNDYAARVAEALGVPLPSLIHIPSELLARLAPERASVCIENFQYSNIFDTTAARADLGFRYTIPFVEGARRTIAWLDTSGRIANSDLDPLDDRLITAWKRLTERMTAEMRS